MLNELNPTMESTGEEGTKITLTLPEGRLSATGVRNAVKAATGVRMELDPTGERNTYTFAKSYRYQVLQGLLKVFPSVTVVTTSVIVTSEDREVCSASCVNAMLDECVCGCDGKYHQGGYGAIAGWTPLGGGAFATGEDTTEVNTEVHVYTNPTPPEELPEPDELEYVREMLTGSLPAGKRTRAEAHLEFEERFFTQRKDAYYGRFFIDQKVTSDEDK